MAGALYDLGRQAFLSKQIDFLNDTIKVALVSASYSANMATDQYWSTVSANVIGTPVALANKTATNGVADADDVTFSAIATGSTITQIVGYQDTGTGSTSRLIFREDVTSTPTNGGTISLSWDNTAGLKIFKL